MQKVTSLQYTVILLGFTVFIPQLLPIGMLYAVLMSQIFSRVWIDLHPWLYVLPQLVFVYGIGLTVSAVFLKEIRINERLHAAYVSTFWLASAIVLIVIEILASLWMKAYGGGEGMRTIAMLSQYSLILTKGILVIFLGRVLLGVVPRIQKPRKADVIKAEVQK